MEVRQESSIRNAGRIIWSADVSFNDILTVAKEKALPEGTIFKLDRLYFERYPDKHIIGWLQDRNYPVFVDAKISEVPDKVVAIAETYLEHHPFMLNVMAGSCSTGVIEADNPKKVECLKRFADACEMAGTLSCAVTVLTSKSPGLCMSEFNGRASIEQVLEYAALIRRSGMTDIVCSPEEAEAIRAHNEYSEISINTPGIRLPNTDVRDQARVMTPAMAIQKGADRLVIGSNLTDGSGELTERLRRNYQKIIENIEIGE